MTPRISDIEDLSDDEISEVLKFIDFLRSKRRCGGQCR